MRAGLTSDILLIPLITSTTPAAHSLTHWASSTGLWMMKQTRHFFLILIDSIRVCPWSLIFLYLFFFFFYTESLIFQAPTTQIKK